MLRGDHPKRKKAARQVGIFSFLFSLQHQSNKGVILLLVFNKEVQCFVHVLCVYFNFRHMEYIKHGLKHMQLEFYIKGSEPGLEGTVHVESKEVGVYIPETFFDFFTDIIGP